MQPLTRVMKEHFSGVILKNGERDVNKKTR
jgi:hypothetical protein